MNKVISWIGFALILLPVLVRIPWSWSGLIVLALFVFVFAPHN